MRLTPDPAYRPRRDAVSATAPIDRRSTCDGGARVVAEPAAGRPEGLADRRVVRRRVRLVRRHLGSGPYLHFGCDRGALLALLAARGSASGFVADVALAEVARGAAPGCPVHTNPDAIPVGVFRGVLATGPADDATLALWRRVLVRGGRVLMIGADNGVGDVTDDRLAAAGFALRRTGRERWWSGAPVVVLETLPVPDGWPRRTG